MTDHDDIARLETHAKKIGAPTLSAALAEFQRIRDKPPLQRTLRERVRLRQMDKIAGKIERTLLSDSLNRTRYTQTDMKQFRLKVAAFALWGLVMTELLLLARWWFE